jgi:hypothetical protein
MENIGGSVVKKAVFVNVGSPQKLQEVANRMAAESPDAEKRGESVTFQLTEGIVLYFDPNKKGDT